MKSKQTQFVPLSDQAVHDPMSELTSEEKNSESDNLKECAQRAIRRLEQPLLRKSDAVMARKTQGKNRQR